MKKQNSLPLTANSDKVVKMYDAVIRLLEEGMDINSIKVSDITGKAGIGKGTAYEYFESKEQIIANALEYDMQKQMKETAAKILKAETFRDKLYVGFSWIEESLTSRSTGIQFMKLSGKSQEICGNIRREFARAVNEKEEFACVLEPLRKAAVAQGMWPEDVPEAFVKMTLISGYIEFFLYLIHLSGDTTVSADEVKEFIYRGILKKLNI